MQDDCQDWRGKRAVLATMHGKERAIAPLLQRWLGLRVTVADDIDTDVFGTFTRDIARAGPPRDAARQKIDAALATGKGHDIGLASEGSFGPHPQLPFCALDREMVLLVDRARGYEVAGQFSTPDTNFSHAIVTDIASGIAFAERVGFPDHGVIVMGCRDGEPAPAIAMFKAIATSADMIAALSAVLAEGRVAWIETDMRAHRNPRRMRAIKRATLDLIRRARSLCPTCGRPGYGVTERLPGLPCAACGMPTLSVRVDVMTCAGCGYRTERATQPPVADPGQCEGCNP